MKKICLPFIALASGFVSAFVTTGVNSMFFVLLPLLAFVLGYFYSWRWGLLNGFLLFLGYTFATSLMWWGGGPNLLTPFQYIYAFIFGGFSLLLLGFLAPEVRKGVRKFESIVVLVILAIVVSGCAYGAIPKYKYYYQVVLNSSANLENVQLYLPVGTVSGEPYMELYDHPLWTSAGFLTQNYTYELVDTEHGRMLKLVIHGLQMGFGPPELTYTGNIIFHKNAPYKLIKLMPRKDAVLIHDVMFQEYIGPTKVDEHMVVERFKVPIKVKSDTEAKIELTLWNRTDRGELINFAYSKSNTYFELIKHKGRTDDEWVFVPVEATNVLEIRGMGD